jgi:predicted  nucleic acid-binding Zn-ribbon protein
MSRAASLLRLQALDLQLDAHAARLRAIEAALGDHPAVRQAQHALLESENKLRAARVAVQSLEYDSQTLNAKIQEVDQRMYGGRVGNPKELQDLQRDQESLRRRRSTLEEQQFEALVSAEAAEASQQAARHALEQSEAEAAKSQGDLLEERARLNAEVDRLQTSREAMLPSILSADLELYDRLRRAKHGRAVTELLEGSCSSCGVSPSSSRIQSARQDNDLILCGNCGRILAAD